MAWPPGSRAQALVLAMLLAAADAEDTGCSSSALAYSDERNTTLRYPNAGFTRSAKACQMACKARGPFCKFFTWQRDAEPPKLTAQGACWVLDNVSGLVPRASATSGSQGCSATLDSGEDAVPAPVATTPASVAVSLAPVATPIPVATVAPLVVPTLPGTVAPITPAILGPNGAAVPTVPGSPIVTPPAMAGPFPVGTEPPSPSVSGEAVDDGNVTEHAAADSTADVQVNYRHIGLPVWGGLVIIFSIVACSGVVCFFAGKSRKATKKKRTRSRTLARDQLIGGSPDPEQAPMLLTPERYTPKAIQAGPRPEGGPKPVSPGATRSAAVLPQMPVQTPPAWPTGVVAPVPQAPLIPQARMPTAVPVGAWAGAQRYAAPAQR